METQDQNNYTTSSETVPYPRAKNHRSGRVLSGLVIVIVGVVLLINQLGANFPVWFFSWKIFLIALGLFLGFRYSFQNPVWFILVTVGTVFLLGDLFPSYEVYRYTWPIIIIAIGLFMMTR